jgi:amino acid adenylation domain-containing protein
MQETSNSSKRTQLSADARELLAHLLKEEKIEFPQTLKIARRKSHGQPPSLSFAQHRLWLLDQLEPGTATYNISAALHLQGALNVAALEQSLNEIVRRHEALRTTFIMEGGRPVQNIAPDSNLEFRSLDLSDTPEAERMGEALRRATAESQLPFDLQRGPLLRANLMRLAEQEHLLQITMHHIVADGWSFGVLTRELGLLYESYCAGRNSPLAELPIQYADYAEWQREWLSGETLEEQLAYWRTRLGGTLPVLQLPTDRPRQAVQTFRGARHAFVIPQELSQTLTDLSQREGVTLFMTLLTAFKALLHVYSGQTDIIVGTPIANRQHAELHELIGMFINTLVMRTDLSGDPGFTELLGRVREGSLEAYAHQDVPFEKLVEELQPERDLSRNPLFQVMFILQNTPPPVLKLADQKMSLVEIDTGTSKFDLTLELTEYAEGIKGSLEYNTDLYDGETIERLAHHFHSLLSAVAAQPALRLSQLPLLTPAETCALTRWNDTATDYSTRPQLLHQLFEQQAARTPAATALVYEQEQVTYAQLNERANQLAAYLRARGVGAEELVGVLMERSVEMVVALLGVLKAGGAYVPLDPEYPRERLSFMLDDARLRVLLTQERLRESLPAETETIVCLDTDWAEIEKQSGENAGSDADGESLAYVIYTSGSTGKPKGVQIRHRAVVNFAATMSREPGLTETDILLAVTTLSFDIAVLELFLPLCVGATTVLVSREQATDGVALAKKLVESGATVMQATPATWRLLLESGWEGRETLKILCGGEALPLELADRLVERCASLWNMYGPTETTIWSAVHQIKPGDSRILIGHPIANTTFYVLDQYLRRVPIGVTGALYIGGDGLARGYLNRPELTAEKFIPDAFDGKAGARCYETGDLARFLSDGRVELLGRVDHQVKIRGYRIELGEIETALSRHTCVREAVVVAREDGGQKRLVAYLIPEGETTPTSSELRQHLKETLPEYMLPSVFVMLDEMPLTPNGKVDRRALPAPDGISLATQAEHTSPRTATEEILAGIWAEALHAPQVGVHDDFFDLGGHSLLATHVLSHIREAFKVELPLRSLFESPTVAALAEKIEKATHDGSAQSPPVVPVSREGNLQLSFAQQRLWFLDQLAPGNPYYNIPAAVRLTGALSASALEQSINGIISRHEVLRTNFGKADGQAVQVIAPSRELTIPVEDLSELPEKEREAEVMRLAIEESRISFNLAEGPLLRVRLLRLRDEEHVVLLTIHHIISDGWSVGVFVREFGALYQSYVTGEAPLLSELPIQYADYAHWQREWLQGEVMEAELAYWRRQLSGAPSALDLPTDHSRPALQGFTGARKFFDLSPALTQELQKVSRAEGATVFMTLLAAFKALLYRYSGQEDIVVGTPIANRRRAELEGLIGFFTNTLVLRTEVSGEGSFRETVRRVREVCLGAYGHQDVPFEKLVEELQPERDLSRTPLFQVMFVLQNAPTQELQISNLTLQEMEIDNGTAKFDLTLVLQEAEQGFRGFWEYNEDLFERETIEQLAGHFLSLLSACLATPDRPLATLPLLSPAERHRIVSVWNDTATSYAPFRSVSTLFEEQVRLTPDAPALQLGERALSYAELNERANQLAHRLRRLGVAPEVCVGICLARSVEMIVAVLGVLKAGGVYVPVDPSYPAERQAYMLSDSAMPVLLTTRALAEALPPHDAHTLYADEEWAIVSDESTQNLYAEDAGDAAEVGEMVSPGNLAYVLYTSGSTGRPKGVAWSHEALTNLVEWVHCDAGMATGVRTLQYASLSFDVSAQELFPTWRGGGTLVLLTEEERRDAEQLLRVLGEQRIERLFIPFVALQHLAEVSELHQSQSSNNSRNGNNGSNGSSNGSLSAINNGGNNGRNHGSEHSGAGLSLREVVTAGEQLRSTTQLRRFFSRMPSCRLFNFYGPTEGNIVTTYEVAGAPETWAPLPAIGRPISNTRVHVLDARQEPVAIGVAGELYIGGVVLARGYLGRAELTAERFVPDPLGLEQGGRLYRTGDMARYRRDGELEFLGRGDDQVKVRGYRVELGEVETMLSQHPGVREAVVVAREEPGGGKRLVAYVVAHDAAREGSGNGDNGGGESGVRSSELRAYLKERLPEYMVPGAYVQLEQMPLSPNRKVDRKALPEPEGAGVERETEYVAARTPVEELLVEIWAELLGLERVSIHDNFFELGGHSLLATQLVSKLQQTLVIEVPLRQIFETPTIAEFAAAISQNSDYMQNEDQAVVNELLSRLEQLSDSEIEMLMLAEQEEAQEAEE